MEHRAKGTAMKRIEFDSASIESAWTALEQSVGELLPIRTDRQYRCAVRLLNELLDVVGADEHHPLAGLLDVLGELVSTYEAHEVAMPAATPREVLRLLMQDQRTDAGRARRRAGRPARGERDPQRQARDQRASGECSCHALRHFAGGVHRLNPAFKARRASRKGTRRQEGSIHGLYLISVRSYLKQVRKRERQRSEGAGRRRPA